MTSTFKRGRVGSLLLLVWPAVFIWTSSRSPLIAQRSDHGAGANGGSAQPWLKPVPHAECGKADRVETRLQGQTFQLPEARAEEHRYGDEQHLWFTSHENVFQVVRFTNRLASIGKKIEPSSARR